MTRFDVNQISGKYSARLKPMSNIGGRNFPLDQLGVELAAGGDGGGRSFLRERSTDTDRCESNTDKDGCLGK